MISNLGAILDAPCLRTLIIPSSIVCNSTHSECCVLRNFTQLLITSYKHPQSIQLTKNSYRTKSETYSWIQTYGQHNALSFIWVYFHHCSHLCSMSHQFTPILRMSAILPQSGWQVIFGLLPVIIIFINILPLTTLTPPLVPQLLRLWLVQTFQLWPKTVNAEDVRFQKTPKSALGFIPKYCLRVKLSSSKRDV